MKPALHCRRSTPANATLASFVLGSIVASLVANGRVASAQEATVTLEPGAPIATVDSRYLSFAIDTAQVVGGAWWNGSGTSSSGQGNGRAQPIDLSDPRLVRLARALGPAVLRVGGTAADSTWFDDASELATPPAGFENLLTGRRWDQVSELARSADLDLMFTLGAGKANRDAHGRWQPDQARSLLGHARDRGQKVAVWELGNEPDAYWLTQGLGHTVSGASYARDYEAARGLVRELTPASRLAGGSSAFWPLLGEPLSFLFGIEQPFLEDVKGGVDVVTWHYYPTESSNAPVAVRRATAGSMLSKSTLGEVDRWGQDMQTGRDQYQPGASLWLGETGPAQCGGQSGLSDSFEDSFWWLDQLGRLARLGQTLQIRQCLVGASYGLLADDLTPNPDFWSSLLWKRLMGTSVRKVTVSGDDSVHAYAHGTVGGAGVTLLVLNLSGSKTARVRLEGVNGVATEYRVTSDSPSSRRVLLNGSPLDLASDGGVPSLAGREVCLGPTLELPPLTYDFLVFGPQTAPAKAREGFTEALGGALGDR